LSGPGARPDLTAQPKLRLDKWLWQARFFKGRGDAADMVAEGYLRLNGTHCTKAGHAVTVGDVLTFPQGRHIKVVRVLRLGLRRGPATEAQALYEDLGSTDLE
jgi:ribosome-associated heat shock protein Hsp15